MTHVQDIVNSTLCTFAAGTQIYELRPVAEGMENPSEIHRIGHDVANFYHKLQKSRTPEYDGVLVTFTSKEWGRSLAHLATALYAVLSSVARHDEDAARSLAQNFDCDEWRLRIAGRVAFVLTLSPVYGTDSSRFNGGTGCTYLLFQTDKSFARRRLPGMDKITVDQRAMIRSAFASNGRPYDSAISTGPKEAYRFIKPLTTGADPLRWWDLVDRKYIQMAGLET